MNTKMDTKIIHSTHAYMFMFMSRPSSLAHKLLVLMLVLMLASLVRTRLLIGQLHLNGFLFSCILINKKQTELLFLFAKKFKLDGYIFSDFVIVLINW